MGLNSDEARELVELHMVNSDKIYSTQEILDSGEISRLKGYIVKPGKVSDSIFGGKGSYFDKSTRERVEFNNPPLNTKNGIPLRIMVKTQRVSTHDIIRGEIPFKDQILAVNHNHMRRMLTNVLGTSQFEVDDLNDNSVVIAAENLEQIPFENVLRAYMAKSSTETSLYQFYINGKNNRRGEKKFCGHLLPDNLIPNGKLPYVMDTPSTKSDEHDESISIQELFKMNVCSPQEYNQIRNSSLVAFGIVSQFLREKGIILVDTKTEHGVNHLGEIVVQDEVYTMDSSRFWLSEDYGKQLDSFLRGDEEELVRYLKETQPGIEEEDYIVNGKVIMAPKSYSKEFARGFSREKEDYNESQITKIAVRYIEGIQYLTGKRFKPDLRLSQDRVISGLVKVIIQLVI